ncbi:cytochrome P450 [Thozetella sp. PMI_491]|nr:cytochrome P450 [Thozetella sp. PMI_491]
MAVVQTLTAFVEDKWHVLLTTLIVGLAAVAVSNLLASSPIANLPLVGDDLGNDEKRRQAYLGNGRALYSAGYKNFKDGIFRIITSRKSPVIVLAPRYLQEVKSLPDDVLSFNAAIEESMHAKYLKIQSGETVIPHTVKTSLTPALVRLNPSIADEVQESFLLELPPCRDWTPVNINQKLLRIVAMVSGRIFIGPELCRSEEYLDAAINYTVDLMTAQKAVTRMRPWKRPFLANHLPSVRQLDQRLKAATDFLRPVVEARQKLAPEERPDDMLEWLMSAKARVGESTTRKLAEIQLGISFAAIHTTTLTTTNAFYNLAAMPEIVPELREEVREVLAAHDNTFSSAALQGMKKLDSFLKETLRFHPASAASFQRKVLRPFTLSNGQTIPAGVVIEVPAYAIHHDDTIFPDADKFDAMRFYKLRQKARDEGAVEGAAQNQFVSVSANSLTFGYGRHACPGRFFAANEIKMIMANALLSYDIKNVEGQEGRYPNMEFGPQSIPDPTKMLLFKRIV